MSEAITLGQHGERSEEGRRIGWDVARGHDGPHTTGFLAGVATGAPYASEPRPRTNRPGLRSIGITVVDRGSSGLSDPITPIEARASADYAPHASERGCPDRPEDLPCRQFDRARHLGMVGRRAAMQTDEPMASSQALLKG